MWPLLLLLLTARPPAQAQDDLRLKLTNGSNPCNGLLQVFYSGSWGFVGSSSLSTADQTVACRSTLCGENGSTEAILRLDSATFWMRHLNCNGTEKHLSLCGKSQWSVQEYRPQTMERLFCSYDLRVYLEDQCAGHVHYSTDGGQTRAGFICGDSFGPKEAHVLCSSLGCGGVKKIHPWSILAPVQTMINTKCSGTEEQLWQCSPKVLKTCTRPANVYCQDHEDVRLKGNSSNVCTGEVEVKKDQGSWRPENNPDQPHLQRWCKQMFCGSYSPDRLQNRSLLTCSDVVRVTLRAGGKPAKCYGTVHVERNDTNTPVCATDWSKNNSALVCRELGCGTVLDTVVKPTSSHRTVLDHVSCSDNDFSLWHCQSKHSLQPFTCNKNVYVICSETVKVRLSDGPSPCSGRVELFFEGQWQTARRSGFGDSALGAVCRHADCGDILTRPSDPPRFNRGPHDFLDKTFSNCDTAKNLSSCSIKDNNSPSQDEKIVDITCKGHTEVFFSGGFCAGQVQVLKFSKLHLLSASSDLWTQAVADAVCAQRRCGSAFQFKLSPKASSDRPLWTLKKCPSKPKSVFECQHIETEADRNATVKVAWVNCTGSKQVNLTERCWGFVNMCEDGRCGAVCADAWTDKSSKLVCKSLQCGENIVPVKKKETNLLLSYSGLHLLPNQPDVHHYTAVPFNASTGNAAYIVCIGAYKTQFDQPKDSCSGNVQLHQEGQWLSVCNEVVKGPTADFLCAQLDCGTFVSNIPHYGPAKSPQYVSELTCGEKSKGFNSCTSSANVNKCSAGGLRCSEWRQVALIRGHNGCSGVVFVFSMKRPAAVSAAGWTQAETDRLCSDLNCGKTGTHWSTQDMIGDAQFWNGSFDCSAAQSPHSLWACESRDSRDSKEDLQLKVSCSEPPVVNISGNCSGLAVINDIEVCSSLWKPSSSHMLCEELNCGGAILDTVPTDNTGPSSSSLYHVNCEPHHERLGQCQRFIGPCTGRPVSVLCTNGVKVKTSDKCGGDLLVGTGEGLWERVCSTTKLPTDIQNTLCWELGCKERDEVPRDSAEKDKMDLNFSVSCSDDHQHLRYCLSRKSCRETPVQLFCKGYKPPTKTPPPSTSVVTVVLSVVLVLVLCVGALLFLRFYLRRRNKSLKKLLPMWWWRKKQQDFESAASEEEYEDVTSPNRLPMLVSDVGGAADKGSSSSQNYYNVDELTQPLTPGDDPPRPSEDSDGQESYDDIAEIETRAEVHAPPQSPKGQQRPLSTEGGDEDEPEGGGPRGGGEGEAEWEARESPDLVLGEDDYLVPPGAEP